MGLIGVAYALQHHHYQHLSVGSEIVSHTPSHAHKVWSNICDKHITEWTRLMPTSQIGPTFKSGVLFLLIIAPTLQLLQQGM